MRSNAFTCAIALAICASLAACGKDDRDIAKDISRAAPPPQPTTGAPASANTPANLGNPSSAERKDGSNPTQGQVDPKESQQHRDFQHKGDAAGPTSPETQPKN